MTRTSKHFLRTIKRLAKKALRRRDKTRKHRHTRHTRKCACKKRYSYRRQRGGELFTDPTFSQAIVPVKTEEGISIFRTADQAKELLDLNEQESYDGDMEEEPVQNTTNKKLNNIFPQNKYNNLPVENAEY